MGPPISANVSQIMYEPQINANTAANWAGEWPIHARREHGAAFLLVEADDVAQQQRLDAPPDEAQADIQEQRTEQYVRGGARIELDLPGERAAEAREIRQGNERGQRCVREERSPENALRKLLALIQRRNRARCHWGALSPFKR